MDETTPNTPASTTTATAVPPMATTGTTPAGSPNTTEAKSRFSAAVDEAKAGAAALGD